MAHIRSILPQRGGVSPVDNNTTFLAHYDEHAHDVLKGIKHNHLTKCFQFNTTGNREYIETTLTLPSSGTIELWYYPYSFYDYNSIFENTINADDWECWIYGNGILRARAQSTVGVQYQLPSANQWYHIAFTWEKTGNITLIVDGVQRATAAISWVDPGRLTLGGKLNTKSQGKMSDVRVWNYAKTTTQVSKSMENLSGEDSVGLIARWKLDEGDGQIAYDYSTTGADALITGGTWVEGRAVYSLVSGGYQGSVGKGVLLEEGTTNLESNPTTFQGYSWGWTTTSVVEYQGRQCLKLRVVCPGGQAGWVGAYQGFTFSGAVGEWCTRSSEFLVESGGQYSPGFPRISREGSWTEGNVEHAYDMSKLDQWQKLTVSGRLGATSAPVYFYLMAKSAGDTRNIDYTMYIYNPQSEKKAYPTSFVQGTRSYPYLAYPKEVINPSVGTLSFWFNPNKNNPNPNPGLVSIGGWTNPAIKDWFAIYWGSAWDNANSIYFEIHNKVQSVGNQTSTSPVINPNSWLFIVARWDLPNRKMSLTVWDSQGTKKVGENSSVDVTAPTYEDYSKVYIGNAIDWTPNQATNSTIDELRIDKIYRTDAEIASWYYQGRNGW